MYYVWFNTIKKIMNIIVSKKVKFYLLFFIFFIFNLYFIIYIKDDFIYAFYNKIYVLAKTNKEGVVANEQISEINSFFDR